MNNDVQRKTGVWLALLVLTIISTLFLSGCGVEEPKVYRVGILNGLDFFSDTADGFKAGMAELGYVEGENIVYDIQKSNFDMAEYKSILQKFVDDEVDLILVFPTEASLEAKAATQETNIPLLFVNANIEGIDLVESVREPGRNITGVRYPGPDIVRKRFEIMRELAPEAKRMWIPYQRGYPIVPSQLEALRPAAKEAGITLIEVPADDAAELEVELQAHAKPGDIGLDAILFLAEPLAVAPDAYALMGNFAFEHKIPMGGAFMPVGEYGSIFGVNIDIVNSGTQAAPLADKILKGTPAGTIPVVSAESFLEIDLKMAHELGVEVPRNLLKQADKVIR